MLLSRLSVEDQDRFSPYRLLSLTGCCFHGCQENGYSDEVRALSR
jgi:hypothetical protein